MNSTEEVVLDFIDGMQQGVSLTALIRSLPDHSPEEIKAATRKLYDEVRINRLSVMGDNGRFYYVFYSLYVRTVTVHRQPIERHETPAPAPVPVLAAPEPFAVPTFLSPDQAVEVLEKAGWKAEPEVVDRPAPERRRAPAVREVIARWRLEYRLSRIIEIVAAARKRKLTNSDASAIATLIREHVKEEQS